MGLITHKRQGGIIDIKQSVNEGERAVNYEVTVDSEELPLASIVGIAIAVLRSLDQTATRQPHEKAMEKPVNNPAIG